jgi:hypothetical protein|tara:strand:+ start:461 stop:619 length:159 start_codon:yes stop_codon:yes gene_type:complete
MTDRFYEEERLELISIINNCIKGCNNPDLRTILDCLGELGFNVVRNKTEREE